MDKESRMTRPIHPAIHAAFAWAILTAEEK